MLTLATLSCDNFIHFSFQVPPNATSNRSSMTVVEVSLPSGFVVDTQSLEKLKSSIEIVKKVETKNDDTLAVIYFDHLSKDAVSLKLNAFRNHMVTEQKPVPIVVYDYYDSGKWRIARNLKRKRISSH